MLDKGFANIDKSLARLIQRGTLTAAEREAARNRLRGTTKLEELADCDMVIEAITEQIEAKKELFRVPRRGVPSAYDLCQQYLFTFDHGDGRGDADGASASWACTSLIRCRS